METTSISNFNFSPSQIRFWERGILWMLLVVAVMGALLRFLFVAEGFEISYQNLLHAHSHLAMMGWAYPLVAGALVFLTIQTSRQRLYKRLFVINLAAMVGMVPAFLYQGYGFYSIGFCTVHLITVYFFAIAYFRDLKSQSASLSKTLLQLSIGVLLLSTIGLWALGPVSAVFGKTHFLYYFSIQFFLHFQFNGWFTLAALGLILKLFGKSSQQNWIAWLLAVGVVLTCGMGVSHLINAPWFIVLNLTGSLIQLIAIGGIFYQNRFWINISNEAAFLGLLLRIGAFCLLAKVVLQVLAWLPFFPYNPLLIREFAVAFIHLTMLGWVSLSIIGVLMKTEVISVQRIAQKGWTLFAFSFASVEIILFGHRLLQAFYLPYHQLLFIATMGLPVAIFLLIWEVSGPSVLKTINELK